MIITGTPKEIADFVLLIQSRAKSVTLENTNDVFIPEDNMNVYLPQDKTVNQTFSH